MSTPAPIFMSLPEEIRVAIFTWVDYETLLTLRLCARILQKEVDGNCEFHVKLDQHYLGFRRLLNDRRIRSCTITWLTHKKLNKNLIVYPNRLRTLVFDGPVIYRNVQNIINDCKSITDLTFTHQALQNHLFTTQHARLFEQLTNLKYLSLQYIRYPVGNPYIVEPNIGCFLTATFPSLSNFKLYYSLWGNWIMLITFLSKHARTLKNLVLDVGDQGDAMNATRYLQTTREPLPPDEILAEIRHMQLTDFTFRDEVLHVFPSMKDLLLNYLTTLTSLKFIKILCPFDLRPNTFRAIIDNNQSSIEHVALATNIRQRVVAVQGEEVVVGHQEFNFDMEVFTNSQVKTLELVCDEVTALDEHYLIIVSNLSRMPNSLTRIQIKNVLVEHNDILMLANNCAQLSSVVLMDTFLVRCSTVIVHFLVTCPLLEHIVFEPVHFREPYAFSNLAEDDEEVQMMRVLQRRFMHKDFDPFDENESFATDVVDGDREWVRAQFETA